MNTYIFGLMIEWQGTSPPYTTWVEAPNAKEAEQQLDDHLALDHNCPVGLYTICQVITVAGTGLNIEIL